MPKKRQRKRKYAVVSKKGGWICVEVVGPEELYKILREGADRLLVSLDDMRVVDPSEVRIEPREDGNGRELLDATESMVEIANRWVEVATRGRDEWERALRDIAEAIHNQWQEVRRTAEGSGFAVRDDDTFSRATSEVFRRIREEMERNPERYTMRAEDNYLMYVGTFETTREVLDRVVREEQVIYDVEQRPDGSQIITIRFPRENRVRRIVRRVREDGTIEYVSTLDDYF